MTIKEMVYETLMNSKKPLMAKNISKSIYRTYNYRISKFMVRDIIWKELKGQFEYDINNYTYWIKKKGLDKNQLNKYNKKEIKNDDELNSSSKKVIKQDDKIVLNTKPLNDTFKNKSKLNENFTFSKSELLNNKLVDYWNIEINNSMTKNIEIDYFNKKLKLRNSENKNDIEIFIEFITKLFKQRSKHRNPEVDLFLENFEEFYDD